MLLSVTSDRCGTSADIGGGIQHAACSGKVRSFLQDFPAA
jgi:hypothetical protein